MATQRMRVAAAAVAGRCGQEKEVGVLHTIIVVVIALEHF